LRRVSLGHPFFSHLQQITTNQRSGLDQPSLSRPYQVYVNQKSLPLQFRFSEYEVLYTAQDRPGLYAFSQSPSSETQFQREIDFNPNVQRYTDRELVNLTIVIVFPNDATTDSSSRQSQQ
jgi:hypothetical protein